MSELRGPTTEELRARVLAQSAAETPPVASHLPGLTLTSPHPLAGREAWQCNTCAGIFYPDPAPPALCPYCWDEPDPDHDCAVEGCEAVRDSEGAERP